MFVLCLGLITNRCRIVSPNLASLAEYFNLDFDYQFAANSILFTNSNKYKLVVAWHDFMDYKNFVQVLYGFYNAGPDTKWFEGGVT